MVPSKQNLTIDERKKILDEEIISLKHKASTRKGKISVNTFNNNALGKDVTQYRITVPKDFAELIKLNSKDFEAIFQCINVGDQSSPKYELNAKIRNKNEE